jgi:HAD superfamily hydrolase (TIGR01509 family)
MLTYCGITGQIRRPRTGALDGLAAIDIPICIVSNADTDDIHRAIEHCRFRVDAVVTSEDARSYKPHAGIFERALKEMKVAPNRVLHVGDSLHSDIDGANRLGIGTCWVCYEERILDLGNARPDHKVSSLLDLNAILA